MSTSYAETGSTSVSGRRSMPGDGSSSTSRGSSDDSVSARTWENSRAEAKRTPSSVSWKWAISCSAPISLACATPGLVERRADPASPVLYGHSDLNRRAARGRLEEAEEAVDLADDPAARLGDPAPCAGSLGHRLQPMDERRDIDHCRRRRLSDQRNRVGGVTLDVDLADTRSVHATILTIGNEVVSGDTENTNASWLSRRLEELGVQGRAERGHPRRARADRRLRPARGARSSST